MADVYQDDDLNVTLGAVRVRMVLNDRGEQQDAVLVTSHLVGVADGMGGHPDGAAASRVALGALGAAAGPLDAEGLLAAVRVANTAVAALGDPEFFRNPGTTLVAASVDPSGAHLNGVWSGDSRGWCVFGDGTVRQVTEDHSYPNGGIAACLGEHGDPSYGQVGTFTIPVGAGLHLLFTTDGAHDPLARRAERALRTERISSLLAAGGVGELVAVTAEAGHDNVTAVLVDVDAFAEQTR